MSIFVNFLALDYFSNWVIKFCWIEFVCFFSGVKLLWPLFLLYQTRLNLKEGERTKSTVVDVVMNAWNAEFCEEINLNSERCNWIVVRQAFVPRKLLPYNLWKDILSKPHPKAKINSSSSLSSFFVSRWELSIQTYISTDIYLWSTKTIFHIWAKLKKWKCSGWGTC